jgi:isopentenyl diphosphate isomerase/L-lactate dehydrogenase-like FMN-dependent dehydrogenase
MTHQKCSCPDCDLLGEYKAPISPNNLREYQWFCLAHIKEYNKNWNYFENMTADEIETFIENDIIGHRKTQKIGATNSDYFNKTNKIRENLFNSFADIGNVEFSSTLMGNEYINALAELNINDKNAPLEVIKSKFKDIVKQLHPDTVGYKEENIEKLKKVLESYKIIKNHYERFKSK